VTILFICTGNICRSPMAEALARKMLELRGRPDIAVHSAGTAAAVGSPASEGAYLVGMEKDSTSRTTRLASSRATTSRTPTSCSP